MQLSFGCHKGRFSVNSLEKTKEYTFAYEYYYTNDTFFKTDKRLSSKNKNLSIINKNIKEKTFRGKTIFVNPACQNVRPYTIVAGKYDLKEFGETNIKNFVSWANSKSLSEILRKDRYTNNMRFQTS